MRQAFKCSASQFPCSEDLQENLAKAVQLVKEAADQGCHLILIQELFGSLYFCQDELPKHFSLALPANIQENEILRTMGNLAKEYKMIIPVSFFEKSGQVYFNSIMVFDADGSLIGGGSFSFLLILI